MTSQERELFREVAVLLLNAGDILAKLIALPQEQKIAKAATPNPPPKGL